MGSGVVGERGKERREEQGTREGKGRERRKDMRETALTSEEKN
jgi:hypothetical protein